MEKFLAALGLENLPQGRAGGISESALVQLLSSVLTPREAAVVTQYYGISCEGKNLRELSPELGVNISMVRSIRNRALQKLRHPSRREPLTALARKDEELQELRS